MKRAAIIKFVETGKLFLLSVSTMKEGGGLGTEPYIGLDSLASTDEIFGALMKVLNASKMNISKPKDFDKSLKYHLNALGLKNHESLYRGSICVNIVNRDGLITFFPSKNGGVKDGFGILLNEKIEIPEKSSSGEISQALLSALEKCK